MAIKDLTLVKQHLFICNGGTCKNRGSEESTVAIRQEIANSELSESVHTTKTLCNGRCQNGPIVISQPDGIWFKHIRPEKAAYFVKRYLVDQAIPPELRLYAYGETGLDEAEHKPEH